MLSTVTNLNDGVATFFKRVPVFGKFDRVRKVYKETGDAVLAMAEILDFLKEIETNLSPEEVMNRAGQIAAFHPGEQVHCGIVAGLFMRIMLYLALQILSLGIHAGYVCN